MVPSLKHLLSNKMNIVHDKCSPQFVRSYLIFQQTNIHHSRLPVTGTSAPQILLVSVKTCLNVSGDEEVLTMGNYFGHLKHSFNMLNYSALSVATLVT